MNRRKKIYRICMLAAMVVSIGIILGVMYTDLYMDTPDTITLKAGNEQEIKINAPLSGNIYTTSADMESYEAMANHDKSIHVDFSKNVTFQASTASSYVAKVKLFGVIPFKDIQINVIDDVKLIPAGIAIGIYVQVEGVLVIDTASFTGEDGMQYAPSENILRRGDYVLEANDIKITDNQHLMNIVENSGGDEISLKVKRKEDEIKVSIVPKKNASGEYKIGIWIKDSAQGIGTLTYVDADMNFGALGHGISDNDTGLLMELWKGKLYYSDITGITKGEEGKPGELSGIIRYSKTNVIGDITDNNSIGIYGKLNSDITGEFEFKPLNIGTRQDVEIGPAQIICSVDGSVRAYDAKITAINYHKAVNREISIEITDPKLLELTGGIVQGMSGSPIIQNDKIIGAVTHVLIDNPTKGYAIFIESMLNSVQK